MPASEDQLPGGLYVDITIKSPKERIQAYLDAYNAKDILKNTEGRSPLVGPQPDEITTHKDVLRLLDATLTPKCTATFEVNVVPALCSRTGNMHGGMVATLLDMCTSMAVAPLATQDFWRFSGVSRNLIINYFRPVPIDSVVIVECEVVQIGKSIATVTAELKRKEDGKLMCACRHDKIPVNPAERMNITKASL